jgi:hypothetical protein
MQFSIIQQSGIVPILGEILIVYVLLFPDEPGCKNVGEDCG